jgi:enamine deaminase RidA (YjgF/YER057c/UK114 family)
VSASERAGWRRETLVADERGRPIPAVVRYGPYVFVAGSDGYRRLEDEAIDPHVAEQATQQCRNSYGRVQRRLQQAGYGDESAVWIQNFTSGQHWRLERMGLWPEYFGEANHARAVSFGAQSRMNGINMLTSVVMAIDPAIERHVAVAAPARGRASRCTRVGPLTFVIGVRGHQDPITKAHAPEETADAFDVQLEYCWNALDAHLAADGNAADAFLRIDAALRAARFVERYEERAHERYIGRIPFASSAIGTPLGGTCEQEIGGIAAAPGEERAVVWSPHDPTLADATVGGGLVFIRNASGFRDERNGSLHLGARGDLDAQVHHALAAVDARVRAAGSSLEKLVRLDVFLRDIYGEDEAVAAIVRELGGSVPALSFIGAEPRDGAEVEMVAIAGAA